MADSLVSPPLFSGTASQDPGDWMRRFQNYCIYKNLSDGQICNLFRVMLVGNAADWLETLDLEERLPTFDELREAFFARYRPPEVAKYKSARDIFSRTQDEAESVDSFIDKMMKSAKVVRLTGETLQFAILHGLKPPIANFVIQKQPTNLPELISAARLAELTIPATKDTDASLHAKLDKLLQGWEQSKISATSVQERIPPRTQRAEPRGDVEAQSFRNRNFGRGQRGALGPSYPRFGGTPNYRQGYGGPPNGEYQSQYQSRPRPRSAAPGGYQGLWREPPQSSTYPMASGQQTRCAKCGRAPHSRPNYCPAINMTCYSCGCRRHISRMCRMMMGSQPNYQTGYWRGEPRHPSTRGRPRSYVNRNSQNVVVQQPIARKNYLLAWLNSKQVKCLLDTGSVVTLISEPFAKKHKIPVTPLTDSTTAELISANTSSIEVVGVADFNINVSGLSLSVTARVARVLSQDIILGTDFLRAYEVNIDYGRGMVSLSDDLVRTPLHAVDRADNVVSCIHSVCIPAEMEMLIPVGTPTYYNGKTVLLEPIPCYQFRLMASAHSFNYCNNNRTVCRVWNFKPHAVVLRKGLRIAQIAPIATVASCTLMPADGNIKATSEPQVRTPLNPRSISELEEFGTDYGFNINPELKPNQRAELLQLLFDYKSAFARDMSEMKTYPYYQHNLELLSNRRVFRRNYRYSPEDAQIAEKQIQDMLRNNIIEESTEHEYNSPTFLVSKKGGSKRFVIDLRSLNSIIKPQAVQLPKVTELIDDVAASGASIFSVIDFYSAFFQIELTPNSRPLTSFSSPGGGSRYQFRHCPFGLSTSPSAMIYVLQKVMAGKLADSGRLYMDDALLFSKNWQDHINIIETLLKTLKSNNLSANPVKCTWCYDDVLFLGFRIGVNGLGMDPKRTQKAPPTNRKGLQRLLGLFVYWRRFIKQFSVHTYHMRELLKQDRDFHWNSDCDAELSYLKSCLTSSPILATINPNKNFVIMCDAAGSSGCGYQILQTGEDGKLHAVSYGGKALSKAQMRWTPAQLELSALCLALKEIDIYAVHRHVTVITDNTHVLHLDSWLPQGQRERRMIYFLSQFRLTVKYIHGCRNLCSDSLSRCFSDMPEADRQEFLPTAEEEKEDFIISVSENNVGERRQQISFDDDGENQSNELTYCMFICEGEVDSYSPEAVRDSEREKDPPLSIINVVTRTKGYGRDAGEEPTVRQETPGAQSDASSAQNETDTSQDAYDTTEVGLEVKTTEDSAESPLTLIPRPQPNDYLDDPDFKQVYMLMSADKFEGTDTELHRLLLTKDQYFISEGLLYKLALPRKARLLRLYPVSQRLCLPRQYRADLLKYTHDSLGHFAVDRLFLTLYSDVYWPNMYLDVKSYCQTCEVCLRTKRNYNFKTKPLNPPFATFSPIRAVPIRSQGSPSPYRVWLGSYSVHD